MTRIYRECTNKCSIYQADLNILQRAKAIFAIYRKYSKVKDISSLLEYFAVSEVYIRDLSHLASLYQHCCSGCYFANFQKDNADCTKVHKKDYLCNGDSMSQAC